MIQPKVGLGTWNVKDPAVIDRLVAEAYRVGYRHIDSAAVYENEEQLGRAIASLPRSDLFITSKLWCTEHDQVETACRRSLSLWRTPYFDQFLVHWPFAFQRATGSEPLTSRRLPSGQPAINEAVSLEDTWRAMERLVDAGLARTIGVSNFDVSRLQRILAVARIKPAVNQVEMHPYLKQRALRRFCADHGIAVTAYSPLGSGRVPVLEDAAIKAISAESAQSPAQVCLAWASGHGAIVIPKTSSVERLAENLSFAPLSAHQMARIDALQVDDQRACNPADWWHITCFE